jgi:alpha-amylase
VRSDRDGYDIIINRETAEIYALADKTGLNIPFIATIVAIYVLFILFLYFAKKRSKQTT